MKASDNKIRLKAALIGMPLGKQNTFNQTLLYALFEKLVYEPQTLKAIKLRIESCIKTRIHFCRINDMNTINNPINRGYL